MEEKSGWNKAFARWGYRERCSSFFCLATPKYTPTAGVCQKRLQDYSRVLQKIKVKPRKAFRALQGFMRVIIGAEGGTRQLSEKDSNQLAVLLDKLKEQGSYGDPVSGTLTCCARYSFLANFALLSKSYTSHICRTNFPIYESCWA